MSCKRTQWYRALLLIIIGVLMAACTDLAGEPAIVATVAPVNAITQSSDIELPPQSPDVANGARIYQQNCTSCHGVNGAGNGELVESGEVPRMGSFLDPVHMRQQSPEFYYDIITNGNLVNLMPPWNGSLSVQERWDVAMYAYTLHYTPEQVAIGEGLVDNPPAEIALQSDNNLAAASPLEGDNAYAAIAYRRVNAVRNWGVTPDNEPAESEVDFETASFSGQITQGSPNASLPDDVAVQLQYGTFLDTPTILDGVIDENGNFSFSDIPVESGATYFAVAFTDGRAFISERIRIADLQPENAVDITVYEVSNAPNIVNQTDLNLIMDYLAVPDLGTGIVVNHTAIYENPTDYVFHLTPDGQSVRVSLLATLPVGSIFLTEQSQTPFIQVPEQFSLIDTRPVYPGEHVIETSYFVAYEGIARTFDLVVNNRFAGEVSITLVNPELSISGNGFELTDEINLGTEDEPIPARVFSTTVDLQAGENLIFDIEGRVRSNTSDDSSLITGDQLLPVLVSVVIAVIVLGGGLTVFLRRGNRTQREIDRLITEINRLEALHDAGQINHDVFQDKRQQLKDKLSVLMSESQPE